jgi:lysyl-tRNA synthetase class 1
MFQKPKTAKRLYFDVIPKAVDEYHQQLRAYPDQDVAQQLANPVYHIHGHNVPASTMIVSFAMLLNLASVAHAEDKDALWGFIRRYAPDASPETHPDLDAAAGFAVRYYNDFVKPTKVFRAPTDQERAAMEELSGLPRRCRQGARCHRA